MDGALVAETKHDIHMFAPFSFPKETQPRINFFDRLTFIPINAQERCEARKKCCTCEGGGGTSKSFVKDFTVNAYDPAKDYIQDFSANAYDPEKDFVKDFNFDVRQIVPFTKDFTATAVTSYRTIATFGDLGLGYDYESAKWRGGVPAPNGKIYGIPYNSTTVLEIDPVARTATTFGNLPGITKWAGGALASNNKIYGIPSNSTTVLELS